jgi:hypothetical protein
MAYMDSAKRTLLFGGNAGAGSPLGDTWAWDGQVWTQIQDIGPSGRTSHAIAYDGTHSRVLLFGGSDATGARGDTWEWDGDAWTQVADTGPSARGGHALAHDSARSRTVLFGGEQEATLLGDTWEWDGSEWTQVADSGPSPRAGHAMCFEPPAARAVLFGGSSESDTWAWNGNKWTWLNDVGPAPCGETGFVFAGQTSVLFGGLTAPSTVNGLTWELVDTNWVERQDMGPPARSGHSMAFDKERLRTVLFGGSDADTKLLSDTWELPADAPPKLAFFTIEPSIVSMGKEVTFKVGLEQPPKAPTHVSIGLISEPPWVVAIVPAGLTEATVTWAASVLVLGPYPVWAYIGEGIEDAQVESLAVF